MVVQHNLTAMNANRYLGINNSKLSKSLEKLSSGYAINRAGDNAAGLAVSEKMRSQIAGMTQGVKNAQDGISMVQTFEGALTETHSILQRMKTLADQMGNGTYDDPVDRTAAQQEFLQLNDELDHIADTDFNGVVVLNGGIMADGAKADANGLIDYAAQVRDVMQLGSDDINTLDNTKINKTAADAAWAAWSTGKGAYDRSDKTKPQGPDSIDIEFKYNGDGTWEAIGCSDSGMDLEKITDGINSDAGDLKKGNGGFVLTTDGTVGKNTTIANVVVDTSKLKAGDTIKLTVNNPHVTNSQADNLAVQYDGIKDETTAGTADLTQLKWKTGTAVESTFGDGSKVMTEETKALFDALQGSNLAITYKDGAVDKTSLHLAGETTATQLTDGAEVDLIVKGEKVGTATLTAGTPDIEFKDINGNSLGKLTLAKSDDGATAGKTATQGKITYTLANSESTYSELAKPSVEVKDPDDYKVSKSNAFSNSEAQLTYKNSITLQVGARTKDAVNFTFKYASTSIGDLKADLNVTAKGLGTDKLNINTQDDANFAIDKIDQAINKVSLVRGTFGAIQNRLEHKIDNMNVSIENLTSAESAIRDTNMPQEMMNFTKQQILAQASQSMLAQANQLPQGVLSLLQ